MPFDFKKEYKEFYMPPSKPVIVTIPPMNYVAVRGTGNPNAEAGEYKAAVGLLYGAAYTIKMSYKSNHKMEGFFEYVVPPLEGFWWQEDVNGVDYAHKETFQWISIIRLPDFVTPDELDWAIGEASKKKKMDFSKVEFLTYNEGLCVQCMHLGAYDDEPVTTKLMEEFAVVSGYKIDITSERFHHEIYLGDPRKGDASARKTVIRHPIQKNTLF